MKNKRALFISGAVLVLALILMCINWFVLPFSDFAIRVLGVMMIISLGMVVFNAVRVRTSK